jgi:hypothetical protein
VPDHVSSDGYLAEFKAFRRDLLGCFIRHGDTLFEIADAMACAQGRVGSAAQHQELVRPEEQEVKP